MATKELKTRFNLEGSQKFKQEMNNCAAAVKVLNSEEKLAEAQFKATGDSEAYAAEKSRILKEQMKQQQAAVAAAEKAIKDLTDQGMKPNDRTMQQWQIRLSNAKTNLSNMQTKLNAVEKEFGEQKTAVKDTKDETEKYNDEMGKVAQGVNFQNTITAIDNLKGHIESVVKKAAQAARAVWSMGTGSGKWADDLITQATQLGVSLEDLQGWQYASQFVDTEVGTIAGAMTKLVNPSKAVTEQLSQLGVALTGEDGQARSRNDLFWDTIDAITALGDAERQESAAQAIFGKKFAELNPLIQAGRDGWDKYIQEARNAGIILSDEQVLALGGVDDSINRMNSGLEALKNTAAAGLSPAFEAVADAVSSATSALSEFLNSEEGKAALEGLSDAVKSILGALLGEDNGQGTFKKIVEGATDAVGEFTKLLEWITNNGETVKAVLLGIGATWTGLSVFKEALMVMQLIQGMSNSPFGKFLMNKGGSGTTTAGAGAGVGTTAEGTTTAGVGAGVGFGTTAAITGATAVFLGGSKSQWDENVQGQEAARAAGAAIVSEVERTTDVVAEKLGQETAALRDEMVRKATEALVPVLGTDLGAVPGLGMTVAPTTANRSALVETIEYMKQNADTIQKLLSPETYQQIMNANPNGGFLGIGSMGDQDLLDLVRQATAEMTEAGRGAGDGLAAGLDEKAETVNASAESLGQQASIGLADGINSSAGEALLAAQNLAEKVTAIMRDALQIHSPSKVFEELGAFTGAGYALGLEQSVLDVNRAAGRMVGAVSSAARSTSRGPAVTVIGSVAGGRSGDGSVAGVPDKVQVQLLLDGEKIAETTVPLVDAKMGAKMAAARR